MKKILGKFLMKIPQNPTLHPSYHTNCLSMEKKKPKHKFNFQLIFSKRINTSLFTAGAQ